MATREGCQVLCEGSVVSSVYITYKVTPNEDKPNIHILDDRWKYCTDIYSTTFRGLLEVVRGCSTGVLQTGCLDMSSE